MRHVAPAAVAAPVTRLLAVVRDLSFCRSLPDVMHIVRREARELTHADGVTFVLRDGDKCHYADESAIAPLWKGRRFPMSSCISGWVMLHAETVAIEDIYLDARIPTEAYRPTFVKSLAMVPVRAADPLGAIGAYWASNHLASAEELEILQAIADATALAMENVRLYDSLQTAAARAEAVNRAKDEWISVLSHELRTPLTPVLGWTRMLRTGAVGAERREHALEVIERNVVAEIRIVDDLLDVSRMMLGKARIDPVRLDVRTVVAAATDAIRPLAERKGVGLRCCLPADSTPVIGDGARLQQAVSHLLSNAFKFTPAGGEVTVTLSDGSGQASIVVEDSGCGIAADVLARIFHRFERADSSPTRGDGGLGIGLFMVRRIVELHGGSVSADSDGPSCGAVFTVHLPLAPPAEVEASPDPAPVSMARLDGLRVFVVEDDRDTRELLKECLEANGAEVEAAGGVADALSHMVGAPFDTILCDLAMPEADGFAMLARVRALGGRLAATPMVALTAHASEDDRRRALDGGFQRYLSKPIDPAALVAAIRTVVAGPRGPAVPQA